MDMNGIELTQHAFTYFLGSFEITLFLLVFYCFLFDDFNWILLW